MSSQVITSGSPSGSLQSWSSAGSMSRRTASVRTATTEGGTLLASSGTKRSVCAPLVFLDECPLAQLFIAGGAHGCHGQATYLSSVQVTPLCPSEN